MSKATLEEVETSANVLSIISVVTYVAVIILGIIKIVAIFTHLCLQLRDEKLARESAEKAKKEREARKAAAAKKKSKKGKSKKSKKSTSKTSSTKSSKKTAVEKKKPQQQQKQDVKPPPKMPSSKVEKKSESATVRSGKNSSGTPRKQNLSVIELHHQDSLLSISSSKQSSEISQSISGLDELIKEMAAKKEKSLPKSEKDYPEVSTPPQTNIDQLPGTPGAAESARKVGDVSNPPPLMAASKANTDSLMLPLSTPPLAPFSPSTPAPSAEPVQPTTGGPPLAGPLAPVGTFQQSLPTSSPPPYSTDVTTTWISSSSSGASKNKTEGVPSDPKI